MPTWSVPAELNPWAIAFAGILAFALGALWYSPLMFLDRWRRAHGMSEERLQELQAAMGPVYGAALAAYVVMAAALAIALNALGATTPLAGLAVAVVVWLGFVGNATLTSRLFTDLPLSATAIDAGYQLVCLTVMGGVLTVWR